MSARRIVFVVFDGLQPLDLVGPHEVFVGVNRVRGADEYRIEVASAAAGTVTSESGLPIGAGTALARVRGPIDTLVVVGGSGVTRARADAELVHHISRLAGRARRTVSICSGALLLAEAGLLDGRRATTHWASCEWLAARHPLVQVDHDALFVRDGEVWTSAGVTSGIDLALALVSDDFPGAEGRELAQRIARWLVVFARRPGGQSQFSESLRVADAPSEAVRLVVAALPGRLTDDNSVPALAALAGMHPRTFARRFRAETGRTPADHVEALRIEAAQQRLCLGEPLREVARHCGYRSVETLHRSFRRRVGTTPERYREHFAS